MTITATDKPLRVLVSGIVYRAQRVRQESGYLIIDLFHPESGVFSSQLTDGTVTFTGNPKFDILAD